MQCTVFSLTNPNRICGRQATRFIPLAIGQIAKMRETSDALLAAYAPVCAHHAEYTPPAIKLATSDSLRGLRAEIVSADNG